VEDRHALTYLNCDNGVLEVQLESPMGVGEVEPLKNPFGSLIERESDQEAGSGRHSRPMIQVFTAVGFWYFFLTVMDVAHPLRS
jgi:hypothetical protein